MREKTIRFGQGRLLPLPIRLLATGIHVGAIIALLDMGAPDDNRVVLPLLLVSALVPAYWTGRQVLAIHQDDHTVTSYWWIMGRKFNLRIKGKATCLEVVNNRNQETRSLSIITQEGISISVLSSISVEKLSATLQRLEASGIPSDCNKKPES